MICATHPTPRMSLNLRKFELCIIRVHLSDLLLGGCAQDFDDLHQLVHAAVPGEDGLAEEELGKDTASAPNVCMKGGREGGREGGRQ